MSFAQKLLKKKPIRFTEQKRLTVWLHAGVYDVAGDFGSNYNCPIATAIKQQFTGFTNLSVCTNSVRFDHRLIYELPSDGYGCQGGNGCGHPDFIKLCRDSGFIVPIVLFRDY